METHWQTQLFPMKLCSLKLAHGAIMAFEPASPKPLLHHWIHQLGNWTPNSGLFKNENPTSDLPETDHYSFLLDCSCTSPVQCWSMVSLYFIGNRICELEELRSPKALTLFIYSKPRMYYQGKMDVVPAPIVEIHLEIRFLKNVTSIFTESEWHDLLLGLPRAEFLLSFVIRDFKDNIKETLGKAGLDFCFYWWIYSHF